MSKATVKTRYSAAGPAVMGLPSLPTTAVCECARRLLGDQYPAMMKEYGRLILSVSEEYGTDVMGAAGLLRTSAQTALQQVVIRAAAAEILKSSGGLA